MKQSNFDPSHTGEVIRHLNNSPESFWRERGEQAALALFKSMATRVPAYKKFLQANQINTKNIKTITGLNQLPRITKENYLRKYPLHELMWDGDIGTGSMISRSSGSSGQPFYWPSNHAQRSQVGQFYDIVFSTMFNMRAQSTLVIIAYGMGSWVAGTTTLLSGMPFMDQYNCTFITPGYNKQEIIEICQDLGPEYEQIVICAYPPLAKEIIDQGLEQGIDWPSLHPKFVFGAEAFGEEFRDYVLQHVGSKQPLLDTMNTIGSADAMVIGHETPLSIALRRLIHTQADLHNEVLGPGRMPTLAQYYPWQKYLQTENDELLISSNGAIPLLRYNIQDHAKILSYGELESTLQRHGHASLASALPAELQKDFDWKLPFVLLYGKSTNAIKFYGAMVYPENVKAALENPSIAENFSGKFRMHKYLDAHQDQRLRLYIELAPGTKPNEVSAKELQRTIIKVLCDINSEYRSSYTGVGRKATPAIKLVPYGQFDLAGGQNKHRYV